MDERHVGILVRQVLIGYRGQVKRGERTWAEAVKRAWPEAYPEEVDVVVKAIERDINLAAIKKRLGKPGVRERYGNPGKSGHRVLKKPGQMGG